MVCKKGLRCVGRRGSRRCAAFGSKGDKCGRNHPRCSRGLVCYSKKHGHGRCFQVQGKNEKCGSPNTLCGPRLICIGKSGYQKCALSATFGEKCGPYYRQCGKGLKCVTTEKGSYGTCHRVVGRNYPCDQKNIVCGYGTRCAGVEGAKQCVKPMGYLQRCDDPYWVCGKGLKCKQIHATVAKCVKNSAPKEYSSAAASETEPKSEPRVLTTVVAPPTPAAPVLPPLAAIAPGEKPKDESVAPFIAPRPLRLHAI